MLQNGILRLGKNTEKRILVQAVKICHDRQTSDDFRDKAIGFQVLGSHVAKEIVLVHFLLFRCRKTDYLGIETLRDTTLDSLEGTAADEQDVLGIDMNELLLRMLAASLRRDIDDTSFQKFQQCLLHALS